MKKAVGICAALTALALSLFPAVAISAAGKALSLCASTLIPSLFPFFVCANTLIASGITSSAGRIFERPSRFLFRVGGEGASAVLLGLVSGYPAGAAVTCKLYSSGSISRPEAQRLLSFTNNAGPLFVIGAVGTAACKSPAAGYILLAAQTLASFSTGFCMRFYGTDTPRVRTTLRKTAADPMGDAVHTVLSLCGFVVFFSVITAFLEHLGILGIARRFLTASGLGEKTAALLCAGFLEVSAVAGTDGGALPAMAGLLAFGGLSVFLQTAALVRKNGLSMNSYIIGKLLSSGLSAFYCRLLLMVFPQAVPANAPLLQEKAVAYGGYLAAAVLLTFSVWFFFRLMDSLNKRLHRTSGYDTIKKKTEKEQA
ncbi:MAG: hypothetical protein E7390_00285 [Ruminococcaceae bacterium]|nr:hypothetical protein [Oscillospiraceae bacterium]